MKTLLSIFALICAMQTCAATDVPVADVGPELNAARKAWHEGDSLTVKARSDLAILEKQEKVYDRAIELYLKALKKDPKHPRALSDFGHFWLSRREYTQARAHLEAARKSLDDERSWWTKLTKTKGRPRYEFAPEEESDVCRTLAGLLERAGDFPQALSLYKKAATIDPADTRNSISLAIALCAGGRPDEALPILKPLAAEPESPTPVRLAIQALVTYTLALAYEENGQLEDAKNGYEVALAAAQKAGAADNQAVAEHAAMSLARVEDLLDSMEQHAEQRKKENEERAKENEERKARNQQEMLPILPPVTEREDFAAAAYRCSEGIKLKNLALSDESFLTVLARMRSNNANGIEENSKEFENHPMFEAFLGSMQAYQEAIQKCTRFPRAHYEMALCNLLMGRYSTARALLDAAALYSPNELATLILQGEVLLEMAQWEEATKVFQRVLALDHESGPANFGLARALAGAQEDAKHIQTAIDALERAAQLGVRDRRMNKTQIVHFKGGRQREGALQETKDGYVLHTDGVTYDIKKEDVISVEQRPGLREQLAEMLERFERGEKPATGPVLRGSKFPNKHKREDNPYSEGSMFQK